MRISDWSSDVCSSDLTFQGGYDAWRGRDPPSGPGVLAQGDRIVAGGTGPAVCRSNDLGRHRAEVVQGLVAVRATAEVDLGDGVDALRAGSVRSEEHTSELQSLMRISYAVFCLKKKIKTTVTLT